MPQFKGRTEDAGAPFLTASFWMEGKHVAGTVIRTFSTDKGRAIVLALTSKVMIEDQSVGVSRPESQVSIGASAGLRMAIDAAGVPGGFDGLLIGDHVYLACTGKSATEKGNDQVNFEIEVNRPDVAASV